ncbi:MAG: hypothetical protein D3908_11125 [Candidatus Electrothrix sp. AUS4]|nr:hypothetical protein [Candidatus Electrothrix sp. AUS4]
MGERQLNEIHSKLDEIVQESKLLIAEFQKITQRTPRNPSSFFGLFKKKRNVAAYNNFRSVDNKLGDAVERLTRFGADNARYLSVSTQAYVAAYGEYLQSVKTAAELRVAFEQQFMELNMWRSSAEQVDCMKELAEMIDPGLEDCEEKAHKVNEVILSFKR